MTSDIENKKWLDDYPALKQVDQNNPFTVPVGYFDELGERITSSIRLTELKSKMPLSGFTVPENYFEELNSNIKSRIAIEKALSVENTGFTVPENYFEELNSQITSRIFVEEALNNTTETLTVPQDYFSRLNNNILNKTVNQEKAKPKRGVVVRMFSSTAFKYATAACLTLMVGTGIFLKQFNSPTAVHNRSFLHKELSNVSVDDIQNYLDLNVDETQHTITSDAVSADDPSLDAALQNYADSTQK